MKYSAFLITFLIATAASAADTDISGASNVATGMAANGDYIIPKSMSQRQSRVCVSRVIKSGNY